VKRDFQEYLAWTYFGENAFDRAEFKRLEDLLRDTTRFIDVGASHGVYTYHANRILEDADIIAIEADPERFAILVENARKWESESTNRIRCINAAASDEEDRQRSPEITFYATGTQISGGLFPVSERSDDYSPTRVPLVCVDDYFEQSAATFVKIDVEGAEFRVLMGARKHISSGNTRFFTEISRWGDRARGTSAFEVLRFCLQSGMRVDRRLRSDYLFTSEPDTRARRWAVAKCVPPIAIRVAFNNFVPDRVRTWRERRENQRRLARFDSSSSE